jgi:hypothetical protein
MAHILGRLFLSLRPGRMSPVLAWLISLFTIPVLLILLVNALTDPAPDGALSDLLDDSSETDTGPDLTPTATVPPPSGIIDRLPEAGNPGELSFDTGSTSSGTTCSSTLCNVAFFGLLFGSAAGIVVVSWLKGRRLKVWLPISGATLLLGFAQPFIQPITVFVALALAARPDLNRQDPAEAQLLEEEEEAAMRAYDVDAQKRTETAREGQFRVMTWLAGVAREVNDVVVRQDWPVIHHNMATLGAIKIQLNSIYIPMTDASRASWRRALEAIGAYEKAVRQGVSIAVQMEYHPLNDSDGFFAKRARNKLVKRGAKVAEELRKADDILEDATLFLGYSRDELLSDIGPTSDAGIAPPQIAAPAPDTRDTPDTRDESLAPQPESPAPQPAPAPAGTGLPTESLREQTDTEAQPRGGRPRPTHGRRRQRF